MSVIWIIQTGEPIDSDNDGARPMRAMTVAKHLNTLGHTVNLITSRFYHQKKIHRVDPSVCRINPNYSITLLNSPGYQANLGAKRIIDHVWLGFSLYRFLQSSEERPDIIIVGYPPIELAFVAVRWAKKRGIPVLVDVKDQWPDNFLQIFPQRCKWIGRLVFAPYFYASRVIFSESSAVSSISASFLGWVQRFGKRDHVSQKLDFIAPLSVHVDSKVPSIEGAEASFWSAQGVLQDQKTFRLVFVGTHSRAFDFSDLPDALSRLRAEGIAIQVVIAGHGEKNEQLKKLFSAFDEVVFPGWINSAQANFLYSISHGIFAPYAELEDFHMSLPNKIIDALARGIPIISSLSGEFDLLARRGCGFQYKTSKQLVEAVKQLLNSSVSESCRNACVEVYEADYQVEAVMSKFSNVVVRLAASDGSQARNIERSRYDSIAHETLKQRFERLPEYHKWPYQIYYDAIKQVVTGKRVLELGAGTGLHSSGIISHASIYIPIDISSESLKYLSSEREKGAVTIPICASMDSLPFGNSSFDVIVSAGALSYADPNRLYPEIYRVLSNNGALVLIDSLNDNPIFKLNRVLRVLRGQRSFETTRWMPDLRRIKSLSAHFEHTSIECLGVSMPILPLLSLFFGEQKATQMGITIDRWLGFKSLSFKFVGFFNGYKKTA